MKKYYLPDGLRVYAIGDVHGHLDALKQMHELISQDLLKGAPDSVHIVYLGDYIDRGPDSRGVIDYLMERRDRGDGIAKSFIKGNHETALFEFMKSPLSHDWLRYGGIETLASYGVKFEQDVPLPAEKERAAELMRTAIPAEHFEFFEALELSVGLGDYLFAHAGIDPYKLLDQQTEKDFTRIREPFLSWHLREDYEPLDMKVVHGHSLYPEPEDQPHRVSVDTGRYEGGPLTAAVIEADQVRFLQVD